MSDNPRPLRLNSACERCELEERSETVCCSSEGLPGAKIMMIGEALGATEDREGRPFVGDAGRKLSYLLKRAGLKRKDLIIGNAVRCRPPANRTPKKKEVDACFPYLLYDILKHKPAVIIAAGATAFSVLSGRGQKEGDKLKDWRGFPLERSFSWTSPKGKVYEHTCLIVPTFHPAAALRDWRQDDVIVHDFEIARRYSEGEEVLKDPETEVRVAKDFTSALKLIKRLRRVKAFVNDLETTGTDPHNDIILCFGFCWEKGVAHVLPWNLREERPFWSPEEERVLSRELFRVFQQARITGQNYKFDVRFLWKLWGFFLVKVEFDTMLAHHCIDENRPHNQTFLCQQFLQLTRYDAVMSQYKKSGLNFGDAHPEDLWWYCGVDVDSCLQLREIFIPLLKQERTIRAFNVELGLILPLAHIEFFGMHIDRTKLLELARSAEKKITAHNKYLKRTATRVVGEEFGEKFNPNSNPQLTKVFEALGADLWKKTPSGKPSLDKAVMLSLSLVNNTAGRIAAKVMELRNLVKVKGTYLDGKDGESGFLRFLDDTDFLYPNYKLGLTVTGRLSAGSDETGSSDSPPIQTVPRVGGVRSMFVPDNVDTDVIIAVDYEKVELCILAWLSNDPIMARELLERIDLHTRMAVTVRLGRDPTDREFKELGPEISKDERAVAKGVNFGIPYGRQSVSIVEEFADNFDPKMPKKKRIKRVDRMIDAYFEKYQDVFEYIEGEVKKAKRNGFLRTYFTRRKRRFPGLHWFKSTASQDCKFRKHDLAHLERECQNYQIQSIASDELSRATLRVWEGLQETTIPNFRIIMSLHDALIFNCHKDHTTEAIELITGWMETVLPQDKRHRFEMPLKVEAQIQSNWGEEYD